MALSRRMDSCLRRNDGTLRAPSNRRCQRGGRRTGRRSGGARLGAAFAAEERSASRGPVSRILCPGANAGRRPSLWSRRRRRDRCSLPGDSSRALRSAPKSGDVPLFGLAPSGACQHSGLRRNLVRSYRTFSPLPDPRANAGPSAIWSLRRFPSHRCAWALPSALPGGVRTFLPGPKAGAAARPS